MNGKPDPLRRGHDDHVADREHAEPVRHRARILEDQLPEAGAWRRSEREVAPGRRADGALLLAATALRAVVTHLHELTVPLVGRDQIGGWLEDDAL